MRHYVDAIKKLARDLLQLIGEGLWGEGHDHAFHLSNLVTDPDSDSLLRLNHYPPPTPNSTENTNIGFGAHTDPQILTILRSNDSDGLQISLEDGVWIPVSCHPDTAFCVNVGDMLQVMTNGRFPSVRHRAVVNTAKSRTSIAYFAGPPPHATITWLRDEENNNEDDDCPHPRPLYRSFTWTEYKKTAYTKRLQDNRLDHFKSHP